MPTVVTDPEVIQRVREAAAGGGAPLPAPTAAPPAGRVVSDPKVIEAVKNRARFNAAAKQKREQILQTGAQMPPAPDRIGQAFDVAADPRADQSLRPDYDPYDFLEHTMRSLPFGDEVGSGGAAIGRYLAGKTGLDTEVGLGEQYQRQRALDRAEQERYARQNPGADIGAQALGIATTGPGKAAQTFAGRVGQGIVGGGTLGTLYGAGEGEGLRERGENALYGGAIGAGTGAVAAPIIEGAVGLGSRLLAPAVGPIANRFRPGPRATKIVEEAFRRDNAPIAQTASRLAAGGPDMVLADVGGANVRGLARAAVNTPGAARERITEFVTERNLRQPERIVDAVTTVLRSPKDFGRTTARMAAERENIASPLYKTAFAKRIPVNVSGVVRHIDDILKPGATQVASPLADLRPTGIAATLSKLRGYFQTAKNQRVDLEQLHRVKMEIDDEISSALKAGDRNKAREVKGVQRQLLKAMDSSSPDYRRARGIYSSSHEIEEALDVGRNAFKMTADDMTEALRGMTQGEREMVQVGLARAVQDQVEARGFGSDVLRTVFKSPKIMNTLRAAFQDEPAFRRFQSTLIKERRMRRTAEAVQGNSTTAAQLSDLVDQKGLGPDALTQLLEGRPVRAVATALRQSILGERGMNEKVANKIADMLLSNDPGKRQRALSLLQQRQGAVQRAVQRMDAVTKLAAREVTGLATKAATNGR